MDIFLKLQNFFMFGTCMCYAVWVILVHGHDKRKLPKLEQNYGHLCIIRYEPNRECPWRLYWVVDPEKGTMKHVYRASNLLDIKFARWIHMRRLRAMDKSKYAELTHDFAERWVGLPSKLPTGGSGVSSTQVDDEEYERFKEAFKGKNGRKK